MSTLWWGSLTRRLVYVEISSASISTNINYPQIMFCLASLGLRNMGIMKSIPVYSRGYNFVVCKNSEENK